MKFMPLPPRVLLPFWRRRRLNRFSVGDERIALIFPTRISGHVFADTDGQNQKPIIIVSGCRQGSEQEEARARVKGVQPTSDPEETFEPHQLLTGQMSHTILKQGATLVVREKARNLFFTQAQTFFTAV